MKRKTGISLALIAALATVFIGCRESDAPMDSGTEYARLGFDRIKPPEGGRFDSFAIVDDSTVVTLSRSSEGGATVFRSYTEGNLIKNARLDGLFHGLCYGDGYLYAFDHAKSALVRLDTDFERIDTLLTDFAFEEIKNLSFSGGKLFFITADGIGEDYERYFEKINQAWSDGTYFDFGETAYRYDIETGELRDLGIGGVVAQALAPDGDMYYYSHTNNEYRLIRLDIGGGKTETVGAPLGAGYVFSFVIYDENLLSTDNLMKLNKINISDGAGAVLGIGYTFMSGGDMQFYKGNLVGLNRHSGSIEVLYLGSDGGGSDLKHKGETIVIGKVGVAEADQRYIDAGLDCGINALLQVLPLEYDILETKLMAGDSDVDIYILPPDSYTPAIRDNGIYAPLNGSEALSAYLGGSFDYVRDYMTTESGDIWGVPLTANTFVTWYVPGNFERFGLTHDDVRSIGSYIETLKRLEDNMGGYVYFNRTEDTHALLHNKYDVNYNDFSNGFAEYRTDVYKNFFELMRSGWVRANGEDNPYFNSPSRDPWNIAHSFDADIVVFQTDAAVDVVGTDTRETLDGWRAFPMPALSGGNEKEPIMITYALVNPRSEKTEAAIEYLEYLVGAKDKYFGKTGAFLMADKSSYANLYDLGNPCFDDLYAVFANGAVNESPYPRDDANGQIVDDYQASRLTIDQVVGELQRRAEMAMGE
jgi:ABC-type glycerol-3-phosphate transport system substrate-binding protein